MPGGVRWHPSDEPFSYTKLCTYYLPFLVFVVVLAFTAFEGLQWLDRLGRWLPSSNVLSAAIVGVIVLTAYFFVMKVVWGLLPNSIRARIPYDRKEASESKGDIRSIWDLRKLMG